MIRDALVKTFVGVLSAFVLLGFLGLAYELELEAFAQWVAGRLGFAGLAGPDGLPVQNPPLLSLLRRHRDGRVLF